MRLATSRRTFVKTFAGLGAGAATQFSGLLRDSFAADAAPLRLIVLGQPNGKTPYWNPRAPGGGPAAETGWTLTTDPDSDLGPLEKHKDSLVVIEGLDNYVMFKPGAKVPGQGHQSTPGVLTGTDLRSDKDLKPTGPSIDVALARYLKVEPIVFKFNQSAIGSNDVNGEPYTGYGEALNKGYQGIFGNLVVPRPGAMDDSADRARLAAEQSVLKHLRADAGTLRRRLAGPERVKLDGYLDSLSLLEQKLTRAPAAGCSKPAAPVKSDGSGTSDDAPVRHQKAMEIIASALACNVTRVAAFHMSSGAYAPFLNFGGAKLAIHGDIVHNAAHLTDEVRLRYTARMHRWYASNVSYLIDLLKAIPEAGGSVYDRTIILWTNELGDAAPHDPWNLPFVLAGGGGTWRKGRYLNFGVATGARIKNETTAHNPLLVSVVNQFGWNTTTFGDPTLSGPLQGL